MPLIENEPTASALKVLEAEMPGTLIVNINYVEGHDPKRSRRQGLTKAREYARDTGNPVIMTSFESEEELCKDPVFVRLMERPNVRFIRQPAALDDYRKAYQFLKQK
ncbi:MAG: hypothetical protein EXS59_02305 [Candidatus Taylorbacteria bacterium]|nr:hypothetical protein [Candidatus Taylorbacteria bacterium]